MNTAAVLDTSAVLAWLRDEPGAPAVAPLLAGGVISAPNWADTWQKLDQRGVDADRTTGRLRILGLRVEPFTEDDAIAAARLWPHTRAVGLSLEDRCCLALAARMELPAVTADTAWAGLDIPIEVRLIR